MPKYAAVILLAFTIEAYAGEVRCFDMDQVRSYACYVMCRRIGADTGRFQKKSFSCICGYKEVYQDYDSIKEIKVIPPLKENISSSPFEEAF